MSKLSYKAIGFLGIGTIFSSIILNQFFPSTVHWMPEGFYTPIIAYEFITSLNEFHKMVLHDVTIFDLANKMDFIFAIIYATFLGLFSYKVGYNSNGPLKHLPYIAILSCLFDWLENICLLYIPSIPLHEETHLIIYLQLFTWLKWFFISLCLFGISVCIYNSYKNRFSFLLISPIAFACSAWFHRGILNELMALSIGISFIFITVFAFQMHFKLEKHT